MIRYLLLFSMFFMNCAPHTISYMAVTKDFISNVKQEKKDAYRILCSENCRNFICHNLYNLNTIKRSGNIIRDSLSTNGRCAWVWVENGDTPVCIGLVKAETTWLVETLEI